MGKTQLWGSIGVICVEVVEPIKEAESRRIVMQQSPLITGEIIQAKPDQGL